MRSQPSRAAFKDDQSGAITVMAVFMASFLIGILFYMTGTGDAILYHEQMQDAADATAFSAAVYDARGMNMISLINLIMAAFLAVMIFLNLLVVILPAVGAIAGFFSFGTTEAIADAAAEWIETSLVDPYEPIAASWLKGLNIASTGVAFALPWVAEAKSMTVAFEYGAPATGGVTAAVSQFPGLVVAAGIRQIPGVNADYPRLGLPVSNYTFTTLCREGGQIVDNLVNTFLNLFHIPGMWLIEDALATALNKALQFDPQFFCGELPFDTAAAQPLANQACAAEKQTWDPKKHKGAAFDLATCQKQQLKDLQKKTWDAQGESEAPKVVFLGALAGDDYFTVYSWATGSFHTMGGGGVDVGAWKPGAVNAPASPHSVAKAEFFYDKGNPNGNLGQTLSGFVNSLPPESLTGIPVDAMWNMRWRARLRRYRYPMAPIASAIFGNFAGDLRAYIKALPNGSKIYNTLSVTGIFQLMQQGLQWAGSEIDGAIGGALANWSTESDKVVH